MASAAAEEGAEPSAEVVHTQSFKVISDKGISLQLTTATQNAEISKTSLEVPQETVKAGEEDKAKGMTFDVTFSCTKLKESDENKWWSDVAFEMKEVGSEQAITF